MIPKKQEIFADYLPEKYNWGNLIKHIEDVEKRNDIFLNGISTMNNIINFSDSEIFAKTNVSDDICEVIREINKIDKNMLEKGDIIGDIFENTNSKRNTSDQGQYFTPKEICKIVVDLVLDVKKPDKDMKTADLFCGSGGLMTTFMSSTQINGTAIYCMDEDSRIFNMLRMNMLLNFGSDGLKVNCDIGDSFKTETDFVSQKIDFGISNPPYGGGYDYDTSNKYIKEIGIPTNRKEYAAVQLYMSILNNGGVGALILPSGFFTNGTKALKIRKSLVEEYNVKHIVYFPPGIFTNTKIETALIVFQKGVGPTENVTFWTVDQDENGSITKNKIKDVGLEEIRNKNYYLKHSMYQQRLQVSNQPMEFTRLTKVKLGDIITYKTSKISLCARDGKDSGKYKFYSSSDKIKYYDTYDFEETLIIINKGGHANVRFSSDEKFTVCNNVYVIDIKPALREEYNIIYLYYHLKNEISYIDSLMTGTTIRQLRKNVLNNLEVSLPSIEIQNKIAKRLSILHNLITTEEKAINLLESYLIEYASESASKNDDARYVKLKDICEFKPGTPLTKDEIVEGIYPVIGGGIKPIGYHNEYNTPSNTILVSRAGNAGIISRYIEPVWKSACFSISCIPSLKQHDNYLYYYLMSDPEIFTRMQKGTHQKHLCSSDIENIEILFPPSPDTLHIINFFQDEIDNKKRRIIEYKKIRDTLSNQIRST